MTYYFRDLTEIIEQAFAHLVHEMKSEYRDALSEARNPEEACEAFADLICVPNYMTPITGYGDTGDVLLRKLQRDGREVAR